MSEAKTSPTPLMIQGDERCAEEVNSPQRKRRRTSVLAEQGHQDKNSTPPAEEVESACHEPFGAGAEDESHSPEEVATQARSAPSPLQRRTKPARGKRTHFSLTFDMCFSLMKVLSQADAYEKYVVEQEKSKYIKWTAIIQEIKKQPPSTTAWLEERNERANENDWVRNKAHALEKLLIEHPFEPLPFSGSSALESMRRETTEFFIKCDDTKMETSKVKVVRAIMSPVRDYWHKIHITYPLPPEVVETQKYQLQQWMQSLCNKTLKQLIFEPESRKAPDNLLIQEGFEKDLHDVTAKPMELHVMLFKTVCFLHGYHADPTVIEKRKQAERESQASKERSIQTEQQAVQAQEEFHKIQDKMNTILSQIAAKLDHVSDKFDQVDQVSDKLCSTLEKVTDKLCTRLDQLTAAVLLGSAKK